MHRRWIVYGAGAMLAGAVGGALLTPRPVGAVAREIVQLQEGIKQLIQNQASMTTTITQDHAAKKALIDLSLNSVNNLSETLGMLQKSVQNVEANSGAQLDTMSTQVHGLSENMQEMLAREAKLSQQLADSANVLHAIDAELAERAANPAVTRHSMPKTPPQNRTSH